MVDVTKSVTLKWRDVRDLLFLAPIFHIAICFTFLFFYSMGFRNSIEAFYSPGDIFSVSFHDVAPGYLTLLFMMPLAMWIAKAEIKNREGAQQGTKPFHVRSFSIALFACVFGLIVTAIAMAIVYWRVFHLTSVASIVIFVGSFYFSIFGYKAVRGKLGLVDAIVTLLLFPLFVAAFSGAHSGERDLIVTSRIAASNMPTCRKFVILRSFGDLFLAVSPTDEKVMIDDTCSIKFQFPKVKWRFRESELR